jgi:hypothetical protein
MKCKKWIALILIFTLLISAVPSFATSSSELFKALYSKFSTVIESDAMLTQAYLTFNGLRGQGLVDRLDDKMDEFPLIKSLLLSYDLDSSKVRDIIHAFIREIPSKDVITDPSSSHLFARMYRDRASLDTKYFDYAPEVKELVRQLYHEFPEAVRNEVKAIDVNNLGEIEVFTRLTNVVINEKIGFATYDKVLKEYYNIEYKIEESTKNKLVTEMQAIAGGDHPRIEPLANLLYGYSDIVVQAGVLYLEELGLIQYATAVADVSDLITVSRPEPVLTVTPGALNLVTNGNSTGNLTATMRGTQSSDLTFVSANVGVATVSSSGLVTAVADGSTTVTITLDDDPTIKKEITVNVRTNTAPPVNPGTPAVTTTVEITNLTDISTNETPDFAFDLEFGAEDADTTKLVEYDIDPGSNNRPVTFTIEDETVAIVDEDGLVTALKVGETTLTITVNGVNATDTVKLIVFDVTEDEETPEGSINFLFPYISGYDGNFFRPDQSITRAEVAAMMAKVLNLNTLFAGEPEFNDVGETHWAFGSIQAIKRSGLIAGYEDGSFRPDAAITRAEIATIISNYWNSINLVVSDDIIHIRSDIESHWAFTFINRALNGEIVTGYPDGSFGPDDATTRAEMIVMVNKLLGREDLLDGKVTFNDIANHWARRAIEAAANAQPLKGDLPEQ